MTNTRFFKNLFCSTAVASLLCACGGSHARVLPAPAPTAKTPAAGANVALVVKIPAHKTGAASRKPAYISASTQSIGFSYVPFNAPPPAAQSANVTPGSPGCSSDASGNTTCTLSFAAAPGQVTFFVTAYDGANGSGNVLGVATSGTTIVAGQENQLSVTLDGVPARFSVSLQQSSVPAGVPADIPAAISAYDSGGNLIVNSPLLSDAYGNPLDATLSTDDSTEFEITQNGQALNAFQGNQNVSILNQPYTGIAVHYDGGIRRNDNLTFTAGALSANTTLTVGTPVSAASLVFAPWYYYGSFRGGEDSSGIEGLPGGANGSVLGVAGMNWGGNWKGTCTSSSAESYGNLTADADGNVAFLASAPCWGSIDAEPAIVAQAPGASSPAFAITELGQDFTVNSFGFDSADAPYLFIDLGNQTVGGVTADHSEIVVLKPGSSGAYSAAMVARSIDYVNNPESILVAPDGTIYAAHVGDAGGHTNAEAIDVFAPNANGNAGTTATPERYIGGALTGLAGIRQMALDSKGNLYVANRGDGSTNSSVTVYAPGASGDVAPIRTVEGSSTGFDPASGDALSGIGIDAFDNLYALAGGTFLVFPAGAGGNVPPARSFVSGGACCDGTIAVMK